MQKYIFTKGIHFITKKDNVRYKKGYIFEMEEDVALKFIELGVLTKYSITVVQIKGQLEELGVHYSSTVKKQELLDLLEESTNVNNR